MENEKKKFYKTTFKVYDSIILLLWLGFTGKFRKQI